MKSILSKIKNLGSYARKTTLSTVVGVGVLLGALGVSNEAKAIIQNDTIWGEGLISTSTITYNVVPYVDLEIIPIEMETVVPDTIYNITTNYASSFLFSQNYNDPPNGLPVYIDIFDYQYENEERPPIIRIDVSGELQILFNRELAGLYQLYDLTGNILNEQYFQDRIVFDNLNNYKSKVFILAVKTNDNKYVQKIINTKSIQKIYFKKSELGEKKPNDYFATYRVKWDHEGFIPDSIDFIIGETYDIYRVLMTPVPPLTQDWKFTIYNINGEPLENALVYTELDGSIDSVRTDANGNAFLADRTLGTTYKLGFGGLENYKAWESNQYYDLEWSVPDEITNPADTLYQTTVTLYPDHVVANGEEVDLFALNVREIFGNYNIMAALYDHVNQYYKTGTGDDFSPTQMETLMQWQEEFTALTGIPLVNKDTPFDLDNLPDFNPYTVDENIVGTNHELGNNYTDGEAYFDMPNYANEIVIVAADLVTLSCSDRSDAFKEWLRTLGYLEGGDGQMAGDPQPMTNQEAGQFGTNYLMGKARFEEGRHTLPPLHGMWYLKDNLEFGNKSANPEIKMPTTSNSTQFISPTYTSSTTK